MQQAQIDVHLRMDADLYQRLRERAEAEDRSIAGMARYALRCLLERERMEVR